MSLPEIAGHELKSLIGSGSCGAVYRAKDSSGKPCAVKVFGSMSVNRRSLAATMRALQSMPPHGGVLPVLSYSFDQPPYYAVSPLLGTAESNTATGGTWRTPTLESMCGKTQPNQAWEYIYEVADALGWMHRSRIPHGNLRPSNVLIEDDPNTSIRITDAGQGWVGGIHHFSLSDHWVHLCPDQIEEPEGVHEGLGKSWDVYSFGVLAYRLLTGRLPRGEAAWVEQQAAAEQRAARGLPYSVDGAKILDAIRGEPIIQWPSPPTSKWEERRRAIIEKSLNLDASMRWSDVREIVRDFERLEADYLIEDAQERIDLERVNHVARVKKLQLIAASFMAALFVATVLLVMTFLRSRTAENSLAAISDVHAGQIAGRDQQISTLTSERDRSRQEHQDTEKNLSYTQRAADQFLGQLLQTRVANPLEADFLKHEFEEALAFEQKNLIELADRPKPNHERVRAEGNIGRINLRLHQVEEAATHLESALAEANALISKEGPGEVVPLHHQWRGQYGLLLSEIRAGEGKSPEALKLLKSATVDLEVGLSADPANRMARFECARAWLEQGIRTRQNGESAEAKTSLEKVAAILDPKIIGSDLMNEEKFLVARSKYQRGLLERDGGKIEESLATLIETAKEMGEIVMGSSPRNQDQALNLAETYTEMAEIIATHFGSADAIEAHNQAIPILIELTRLHPEWAEAKYLLARNYGSVASLDRDTGKTSEAQKKKQDAIELINEVLADQKENTRYQFALAKLRGEYAELLSDAGRTKEAQPIIKQAITTLEELLGGETEISPLPERRSWQIQLATFCGVQGHAAQMSKSTELAKTSFAKSLTIWEKLASANPNDPIVQQGLNWTKGRLEKRK